MGSQAGAGEWQIILASHVTRDSKGLGRETDASRRGPWQVGRVAAVPKVLAERPPPFLFSLHILGGSHISGRVNG